MRLCGALAASSHAKQSATRRIRSNFKLYRLHIKMQTFVCEHYINVTTQSHIQHVLLTYIDQVRIRQSRK